ncbi:MAG: hypothetical protein NT112_04610 [Methanoregula sp.]|nr:hypothetical protein [Methanoregula sp.]
MNAPVTTGVDPLQVSFLEFHLSVVRFCLREPAPIMIIVVL